MAALRLAGPSMGLLSSTVLTRTPGIYATAGSSISGSLAAKYHASRYAVAAVLPSLLSDIWESILRAVPKKKTSHMKKRHRQMAGKALKDNISLNTCPACGNTKRAHLLCPHCVARMSLQLHPLILLFYHQFNANWVEQRSRESGTLKMLLPTYNNPHFLFKPVDLRDYCYFLSQPLGAPFGARQGFTTRKSGRFGYPVPYTFFSTATLRSFASLSNGRETSFLTWYSTEIL